MNLVNDHDGVSVPNETGKLVTLHNECMPGLAEISGQKRTETKLSNQLTSRYHQRGLVGLLVGEPGRTFEPLRHVTVAWRHHPKSGSAGDVNRLLDFLRRLHVPRRRAGRFIFYRPR
jgi:hypothetical protein